MAIAIAILGTLLAMLLVGGGVALAIYGFAQQNQIRQSVEQKIVDTAVALNTEAWTRHNQLAEQIGDNQISVWIPPNEGCEICGNEAVVVRSRNGRNPIWLCGCCVDEDDDFD